MPDKLCRVRLRYGERTTLADDVPASVARRHAQAYSQRHKNRAVEVVARGGAIISLYLNGKEIT